MACAGEEEAGGEDGAEGRSGSLCETRGTDKVDPLACDRTRAFAGHIRIIVSRILRFPTGCAKEHCAAVRQSLVQCRRLFPRQVQRSQRRFRFSYREGVALRGFYFCPEVEGRGGLRTGQ